MDNNEAMNDVLGLVESSNPPVALTQAEKALRVTALTLQGEINNDPELVDRAKALSGVWGVCQ